jgi:hypothetical protein
MMDEENAQRRTPNAQRSMEAARAFVMSSEVETSLTAYSAEMTRFLPATAGLGMTE